MNILHHHHYQGLHHLNWSLCANHWDLLNFTLPHEVFTTSHKDHVQFITENAEFIVGILLDYKTQLAQDAVLNASMYQEVGTFYGGDLV